MYFHGDCMEPDDHHLVADIVHGGESLLFLPVNGRVKDQVLEHHEKIISSSSSRNHFFHEEEPAHDHDDHNSVRQETEEHEDKEDEAEEEIPTSDSDADVVHNFGPYETDPTSPIIINLTKSGLVAGDETHDGTCIIFFDP